MIAAEIYCEVEIHEVRTYQQYDIVLLQNPYSVDRSVMHGLPQHRILALFQGDQSLLQRTASHR